MEIFSNTTRFALACNTSEKIIGNIYLEYIYRNCNRTNSIKMCNFKI